MRLFVEQEPLACQHVEMSPWSVWAMEAATVGVPGLVPNGNSGGPLLSGQRACAANGRYLHIFASYLAGESISVKRPSVLKNCLALTRSSSLACMVGTVRPSATHLDPGAPRLIAPGKRALSLSVWRTGAGLTTDGKRMRRAGTIPLCAEEASAVSLPEEQAIRLNGSSPLVAFLPR